MARTSNLLAHLRGDRPMRWSMDRTICLCGSSCGLQASIWPEISPVSPPRHRQQKRSLKSNSPPFLAQRQNATHASCSKIGRAQDQLLIFCDYPGESRPPTTARSEAAALRDPAKSYNGYRAMWAAQAEADVRTTVDTARLKAQTLPDNPRHLVDAAKTAP